MNLLELFCAVHDFWTAFCPHWYKQLLETGAIKRVRTPRLCESEIMTILIHVSINIDVLIVGMIFVPLSSVFYRLSIEGISQ